MCVDHEVSAYDESYLVSPTLSHKKQNIQDHEICRNSLGKGPGKLERREYDRSKYHAERPNLTDMLHDVVSSIAMSSTWVNTYQGLSVKPPSSYRVVKPIYSYVTGPTFAPWNQKDKDSLLRLRTFLLVPMIYFLWTLIYFLLMLSILLLWTFILFPPYMVLERTRNSHRSHRAPDSAWNRPLLQMMAFTATTVTASISYTCADFVVDFVLSYGTPSFTVIPSVLVVAGFLWLRFRKGDDSDSATLLLYLRGCWRD